MYALTNIVHDSTACLSNTVHVFSVRIYILHDIIQFVFVFLLDIIVWFYAYPTKVIAIGGRFTFEFGYGHNYP